MTDLHSFRHAETRCPQRNYKLDASTHVQGDSETQPEPGDASVCINCGQVLTYEKEGRLRRTTVREIGALMAENPQGWQVIEQAQIFIRQRGKFA